MVKYKVKLNKREWLIDIAEDLDEYEAIEEAQNQLLEQIQRNNESIKNIFWEELIYEISREDVNKEREFSNKAFEVEE